jgi:hypothetical protein
VKLPATLREKAPPALARPGPWPTTRSRHARAYSSFAVSKVFFSHASEDKSTVDAVYGKFVSAYPHHAPWVDTYEIVGGQGLLDKIAAGMDDAEKFIVFLSPVSVTKPWVQRELRRALIREIEGVDPDFIVPVKIGGPVAVPAFLEGKLWIDLGTLTEQQWLAALDAAITGVAPPPSTAVDVASIVGVHKAFDLADNSVVLTFSAKAWAMRFAWDIRPNGDMIAAFTEGLGMSQVMFEHLEPRRCVYIIKWPKLTVGEPISFRIKFAAGVDPAAAMEAAPVIWLGDSWLPPVSPS